MASDWRPIDLAPSLKPVIVTDTARKRVSVAKRIAGEWVLPLGWNPDPPLPFEADAWFPMSPLPPQPNASPVKRRTLHGTAFRDGDNFAADGSEPSWVFVEDATVEDDGEVAATLILHEQDAGPVEGDPRESVLEAIARYGLAGRSVHHHLARLDAVDPLRQQDSDPVEGELQAAPQPNPSPLTTDADVDEGLLRRLQEAEVTGRHLREMNQGKQAARAAGEAPWTQRLTMVEAIIVWWEASVRGEVLGREDTEPVEGEVKVTEEAYEKALNALRDEWNWKSLSMDRVIRLVLEAAVPELLIYPLRARVQPRRVSREVFGTIEDYLIDTYGDTRAGAKEGVGEILQALGIQIEGKDDGS